MKTFSLVWFSGSGARISSHMGAACALEDLGVSAKSYGGISGGAIVATLLSMGKANALKEEILKIKSSDLFSPDILQKDGGINAAKSILGLAITGGKAISRFSLPSRLNLEIESGEVKGELFTYNYNQLQKEPQRRNFDEIGANCWADVLRYGSSIPVISKVGLYSDAGIEIHYPPNPSENSILFSVVDKPRIGTNVGSFASQMIERNAYGNKRDQKGKGLYIDLPAFNQTTEYDSEKMRESFNQSYSLTKKILTNGGIGNTTT